MCEGSITAIGSSFKIHFPLEGEVYLGFCPIQLPCVFPHDLEASQKSQLREKLAII